MHACNMRAPTHLALLDLQAVLQVIQHQVEEAHVINVLGANVHAATPEGRRPKLGGGKAGQMSV